MGLRALVECGFESPSRFGFRLAVETFDPLGFDLSAAVSLLDRTRNVDEIADLDIGVRTHACGLERRRRDDAVAVADLEDRWTAGLFDLDDLAFEMRWFARFECSRGGDLVAVGNGFDPRRVGIDIRWREGDVAVVADLIERDDELIADCVVSIEGRFVNETGDFLGEIDEDAVFDDAVYGREIGSVGIEIGDRTR